MSYKLAGVIWNDDGTMATKELTPLQALERIVDTYYIDNMDEEISVIETTLKDYERVMVEKNDLFKRWAKEHQVLEIIKEKTKYSVEFDDSTKTIYIDCSLDCDNREYELLKEILK